MRQAISRRAQARQGSALIIAIFAMVFLFGVTAVLFSLVAGENSSANGSVTAQSAQAAADAGLQQGAKAVLENPEDPQGGAPGANSKSGLNSTSKCDASGGTPLSEGTNGGIEQKRNHEQKYCYTVTCPGQSSIEEPCGTGVATVTAYGAARDYEGITSTAKLLYTYAHEQETVKIPKPAEAGVVRANAQPASTTKTTSSSGW